MEAPSAEDVRATLAGFDERGQKIVVGLFSVMIQNAEHIRDREWIARQLAEIVTLAGGFEADSPAESVAAVHAFLEAHAAELLGASFQLFQRVGLDLASKVEEGFTFEEALAAGLSYLPK